MINKGRWVDILLFNFCIVALLGVTLRSKILFSIPFFDYNRLLDAHFHFAFGGWVTLAIAVMFIVEIFPVAQPPVKMHQYVLLAILGAAWLLLISSPLPANSAGASLCSTIFILATYFFAWVYAPRIYGSEVSKTVKMLALSALASLVLSSSGVFVLAWLFASKSLNSFAYRDALYTYLHLQYNGFFSLSVFAVFFHKLESSMSEVWKRKAFKFSLVLCLSVIPSMFLTYLWRDPNDFYRVIAIIGSVSLLLCCALFAGLIPELVKFYERESHLIRNMVYLSLSAFLIKTILQGFTLFPAVGNAVFGDRPVIIGFLHLVFLGFVTLFIVTWLAQNGFLNLKLGLTRFALVAFTCAIILNEAVLMTQGLGAMFIKSSYIFPWLLWFISIALLLGALLILAARIQSKSHGAHRN